MDAITNRTDSFHAQISFFFQKSTSVHILNGPLYRTCAVYIDDFLFHGQNDEDFILNTSEIFEICRNKGVILSAKELVIGIPRCPSLGMRLTLGLNLSQARIDSSVHKTGDTKSALILPELGKLLSGSPAKPLSTLTSLKHDMIAAANKHIQRKP